jgi:hypothetical protein
MLVGFQFQGWILVGGGEAAHEEEEEVSIKINGAIEESHEGRGGGDQRQMTCGSGQGVPW